MGRLKVLILLVAVVGARQAAAQDAGSPTGVWGTVRDEQSSGAIAGVNVRIFRGDSVIAAAETDTVGRFELPAVTPGKYTINLRRIGYPPRRVPVEIAGDTLPLQLDMKNFAACASSCRTSRVHGSRVPAQKRASGHVAERKAVPQR